eukprot:Awhi_evm1s15550
MHRIVSYSASFLSLKPLVWIGSISYALYLWHWPIWVFVTYNTDDKTTVSNFDKYNMILETFVAAIISTDYLENMFRDKRKVPAKKVWILFVCSWTFLFLVSLGVGYFHEPLSSMLLSTNNKLEIVPVVPNEILMDDLVTGRNPYPDSLHFTMDSILESSKEKPFFYYPDRFQKEKLSKKKRNEKTCIAIVGSSHGAMYGPILTELAAEYKVTIGFLTKDGDNARFQEPLSKFDRSRISKLQQWKPKKIFFTDIFVNWGTLWREQPDTSMSLTPVQSAKRTFNTLFQSSPQSEIVVLGQIPTNPTTFGGIGNSQFENAIAKKFKTNNSLNFLTTVEDREKSVHWLIEEDIKSVLKSDFGGKNISFNPVWHLFTSPETGKVQIVGSETAGKLLYRDRAHLNLDGARRVK